MKSETGGSSLNAGFLDKSFVNDVWTTVDKPECRAFCFLRPARHVETNGPEIHVVQRLPTTIPPPGGPVATAAGPPPR